jgi:hypothetical protein
VLFEKAESFFELFLLQSTAYYSSARCAHGFTPLRPSTEQPEKENNGVHGATLTYESVQGAFCPFKAAARGYEHLPLAGPHMAHR